MPSAQSVFEVHITLDGVVPAVWRRLLVPANVKLSKLHEMLQATMGWTGSHLHRFDVAGISYGPNFDDHPEDQIDEAQVTVLRAIGEHARFLYEYDFGDGWEHEIVVEAAIRTTRVLKYAVCLAGENACPPEDCGGPGGYADLLKILRDPSHEEHDFLAEWVGGSFDPTFFDLIRVNTELQHVR
jgi:hypothetical protein